MSNPFDDLVPDQPKGMAMGANPFDDLVPSKAIADTSATGAFGREAAFSAFPAAGGLVGAGAGAELGAEAGGAIGALFGGAGAVPGAFIGGAIGGLGGAFGASWATGKAQDYALKKLPDDWQDQIEKQRRADETAHPYASFIGGNIPFLATMSPVGATKGAAQLAENATTLQKIMASPITGRAFGGALMGGMELGDEYAQGDVNWNKVAISTGLGVVFNHTNRIGEALTGLGEAPVKAGFGALKAARAPVTVAQANEANIVGPGVTEEVAQGTQQRDEAAEQIAQEQARQEAVANGAEPPPPDVHELARRMEPETFSRYDDLTQQRDAIRQQIDALASPPDEQIAEAEARENDAVEALRAHLEDRGGYKAGPEARRLRANLRAVQAEIQDLYARRDAHAAGEGVETPEMAQLRQHLIAIDEQMRDTGAEVAAAYRRAADAAGGETVEPEAGQTGTNVPPEAASAPAETPAKPAETSAAAPVSAPPAAAPETREVAEQRAWIEQDLTRRLIAAGEPRELAEAEARVNAEWYSTMAQRMGEARADLFYVNEHPDIKGRNGRLIRAGKPPGGIGRSSIVQSGGADLERITAERLAEQEHATREGQAGLTVPERASSPANRFEGEPAPVAEAPKPDIPAETRPVAETAPEPSRLIGAKFEPNPKSPAEEFAEATAEAKARALGFTFDGQYWRHPDDKVYRTQRAKNAVEDYPDIAKKKPAAPAPEPAKAAEAPAPKPLRVGDLMLVRKRGSNLITGGYDSLTLARAHKVNKAGKATQWVSEKDGSIIKHKEAFEAYRPPAGMTEDEVRAAVPEKAGSFNDVRNALREAKEAKGKPEADNSFWKQYKNESGQFHAGGNASATGRLRELPSYIVDEKSKAARDWFRGFDAMEARKPAEAPSPEAVEPATPPSPEAANEPSELDQGSAGTLEGVAPEGVQGAPEGGQAGAGVEGRGGTDLERDGATPALGDDRARGLGDGEERVPVPAAGEDTGRGSERGGEAGAGSDEPAQRDAKEASRDVEADPAAGRPAQQTPSDFAITDEDNVGGSAEEGGFKAKTKFRDNIAAIETLRRLELANEKPTREDQAILAKWVGWGGLPQAFRRSDGKFSKGWEREGARLEELLSPAELRAAEASTRNAHYTSPEIVKGMWAALKRLGFDGGRVLEPSMGVGNFFGLMPKDLRSASALNGVELDPITGGIAKLLYPNARVAAPMSFVDYTIPDGHFDAVIGNPPFGKETLYDPARPDLSKFSIHNYFFAKAMDGLRPGGVMAMVVTNRFLDGAKDAARQYLAERADLVGAIRLPNKAFSKNANTEVTTDIIFLRRRPEGEAAAGEPWLNVVDHTDKNGQTVPLNEYFAKHPEQMLGEFGAFGSMYRQGDAALIAREGQDTAMMLDEAITRLPQNVVTGDKAPVEAETIPVTADLTNVRVGSMFVQDGRLLMRDEDSLGERRASPVELEGVPLARATGMVGVRDAFATLRRLQLDPNATDAQIAAARADLNKVYDAFVKEHGFINSRANQRVFEDDPSWPQIAALEDSYDEGLSKDAAKKTGEQPRAASAKKAAVFTKRTQKPYEPVTTAATAKDALVATLSDKGRLDLDHMERLYGKPQAEIVKELGDLVYNDPVKGHVVADEYLSGNVKKKLAEAKQAAEKDPAFERNVRALEAVQPADIDAVDITVKPGSHWIPRGVMEDFARHISGVRKVSSTFNPETNRWTLKLGDYPARDAQIRFGTDRAGVEDLLNAVANQTEIVIRDRQRDGSNPVNAEDTAKAKEKANLIKEEWNRWLMEDDARREQLSHLYNDMFNTDVQRTFDGSHLSFPGKVDDNIITLRPHQKNAIWRMLQSGTTLLDHVVGAGKTFTMIGGAMEMRRIGQARKPMFVVPNHLVLQWAKDFVKLYPGAQILAFGKDDFGAKNRKQIIARVGTGDWDAVIVPHSSFGKIEVDPQTVSEYIDEQVKDLEESLRTVRQAEGNKDSKNVKQIQKRIADMREKQKKLLDTGRKDNSVYFDELGVDALFLDEAHEFKNLAYSTGMNRVAGLGNPAGSDKASDMHLKVQQILKSTGGRNVVFATGTPISNTMAEMYTMQRYLDSKALSDQGLRHFDAWARLFGEVVTDWELSPAGKYKLNSRFARFNNLPELMQRYQSFADVINHEDIKRMLAEQGKTLPIPKVEGGKPNNVVVERSPEQAAYIGVPKKDENGTEHYPQGSLIWRSENLPKKRVPEKGDDNMLKIMSDARKAALDMRLIDPNAPDFKGSKVNQAARSIKETYDKWTADKGAQLVFCDLSTPKGAVAKERAALKDLIDKADQGDEAAQAKLDAMSPDDFDALNSQFSVYDDLKAKLIAAGIPEKEIAFIHDANTDLQKQALFAKVRSGQVRVLMGSTAKMGAGMNVQERLVALHHLDAPWRPSDLEQREGRIIRQGNVLYERDPENFRVGVHRYATKETLDARMWQTLEGKATFIEQIRKAQPGVRSVEDVGGEAMNSAEMKAAASGNPKILEEMQLRKKLTEMQIEEKNFNREQYRIKDSIKASEAYARQSQEAARTRETDAARQVPEKFAIKIGGKTLEKRTEAGEAILKQAADMNRADEDRREIGSYGEFKVNLDRRVAFTGEPYFFLEIEGTGRYRAKSDFQLGADAQGVAMRFNGMVEDMRNVAAHHENAASSLATAERLRGQVQGAWPKAEALSKLRKSHENLVQELRGNKPLPDGYTVQRPAEGSTEWTVVSPDGQIVGRGFNEDAARKDFFSPAKAKEPAGDRTYEQRAQGAITFREGKRAIIRLAKTANASTFMHESAHDWLEKMIGFGARETAPADVKADVATIRSFLGMKEDAAPTRAQHEKFARAFEQYLREGRAPSARLVRVFEKFKGWLTQIYRTLKGLGAPISDDIRGVFDRMLAVEPGRAVVAPEAPAGRTLEAIHEADAEGVEPHEAEAAAARVDAERAQAEQEPPEDVRAELAAALEEAEPEQAGGERPDSGSPDAGGEPVEGAQGRGEVVEDRGQPKAKPEGGGVGGGASAKRAGERKPVAQGDSTPEGTPGGREGPNAPLAPKPNELLPPAEPPVLDKAGNIRLDNLNTSEDVAEAIREAARANDDFIGDRRGIVTDAQVEALAEALGMSADDINRRKVGQAFNAEQVWAARKLLIQSAKGVADAMRRAAAGDQQAIIDYAMAKDRHRMIQAQVAGITAEAGRALRAFRMMPMDAETAAIDQFVKQATGKTLYQLEEEAKLGAQLQTPEQVSKFVADASKRTFGRMVLEYWINGLISGPATHTTYMIGNLMLALEKAGPETALAAGIGRARAALGRPGETVQIGEVGAQMRGLARSLSPAMRAAIESLREGQTALLPGETPWGAQTPLDPGAQQMGRVTYDEASTLHDVMASTFGMLRGMRDGFMAGAKLLAAGGAKGEPIIGTRYSNLGLIPDVTLRGVNVLPIGTAARLPSRFIAAIHTMFRGMNYSMEKAALAYRQAASEGLEGAAFDKRIGELRENPPEEMMDAARSEATTLTLMGKGSAFVQALSRLTNTELMGFPVGKFILPFVHIGSNIIDEAILKRTPAGVLSPEIRADLAGKNGSIAQDKAMARMMAGTALAITFGGLAAQGLVSGAGPKDPRQAAMWRLAGNQPHSVKIGDTWYDVHRLGPLGMLLGMSADLYEAGHSAEQGEFLHAASQLHHAIVQNILDESFMRGVGEFLQAVEDPTRYGESYLRNFASSFIPYSVGMGQMDRATDPYSRRAKTVIDAMRAKIPGLSEGLFPKRDIWGEEVPNPEALGASGLTAVWERRQSTDPVNLQMVQLGLAPARVPEKIRNVQLTDQQYDDFARIAGRMAKRNLDRIVQSPEFGSWPAHARAQAMKLTIEQAREAARGMMMMKYPQIARDAFDQKRAGITAEPTPLQ